MDEWVVDKEEVGILRERAEEAARLAVNELKEQSNSGKLGNNRKRNRDQRRGDNDERDRDDDVVEAGMPSRGKRSRR